MSSDFHPELELFWIWARQRRWVQMGWWCHEKICWQCCCWQYRHARCIQLLQTVLSLFLTTVYKRHCTFDKEIMWLLQFLEYWYCISWSVTPGESSYCSVSFAFSPEL